MSSNVPKTLGVAGSRWAVAAVALCLVGGAAAAFDPDRAERAWTHSQVAYCRMGSDLNSGYPAQVVDWNCSWVASLALSLACPAPSTAVVAPLHPKGLLP